ncbi:MAG: cation-translocating P-type ATPase [Clostridia bacterium]|nr:cation-translocating P-type ATPase [Clostridia bacterium]
MSEKKWYSFSVQDTAEELKTNLEVGLSSEEVQKRYETYGKNEIVSKNKKPVWKMVVEQFADFMIIVLLIAAIVSGVVSHEYTDSIIILLIVILNAVIGVVQELKAQKSLDSLKQLSAPHCKVLRNGDIQNIESKDLVPGDVVILETGDSIPADLRLVEAVNLKIQESALTGESMPVEKMAEALKSDNVGIGDRINCAFSSGIVTYGRGMGIVVATGMETEVGHIATMLDSVDDSETPLKQRLESLGKVLGTAALIICLVIFLVGYFLYHREPLEMFMTAVSLAVAAIPEGLPAISTIVLSLGVQRMVKRNAIIRTLPSVETLGSATVICSDKTGTLTQNRMTVEKVYFNHESVSSIDSTSLTSEHYRLLLHSMSLCNDSKIKMEGDSVKVTGDPTETALVDLGLKSSLSKDDLEKSFVRAAEIPFDSERKLMTTVHAINAEKIEKNTALELLDGANGKYVVYTKGGVDELLARCTKIRLNNNDEELTKSHIEEILKVNDEYAGNALRVLAMAYKVIDEIPVKENIDSLESNLTYIGMVGMIDPARPEVKSAVETCAEAGIRPVMITGDHKATAIAIAKEIGILREGDKAITGAELEEMSQEELEKNVTEYSVYARVSPEHKVRIVKAWKAHDEIVAMTGDGVNDAPALKAADIGAAMGMAGTDVAKEAADVVLTDDNFATIVSAVEEGRRIYDNIVKAVAYLLSANIGEIITLFVATMLGWVVEPLLPIHILWINLVTDSLPALALSVDPAENNIMNRKAKKNNNMFTKGMIWRVIYQGIMIGGLTLLAFGLGCNFNFASLEANPEIAMRAQTMAFSVLALSELVHVFNLRSNKDPMYKVGWLTNKILLGAIAISASLMIIVLAIPGLREIFKVATLGLREIGIIAGLSIAPLVIVEIFKLLKINTIQED